MSYQILPIVKAVKAGILDPNSRREEWINGTHMKGLKFANDGRTILYAKNTIAVLLGNATWDDVGAHDDTYSCKLEKKGAFPADEDGSIHLQFDPIKAVVTLADLGTAIAAAPGGNLNPVWSFHYKYSADDGNFAQFELRFENPDGEGWLEITILPQQGRTGGSGWADEILNDSVIAGIGGNTPDGSVVWGWPPRGTLASLLDDVHFYFNGAEQGQVATNYVLKRVRIELWEAAPARTCNIDDIKINGKDYVVEPGLEGAKIGPNLPITTLAFVEVRDRFGRMEVLNPILGAAQELIVGPLLPALFNDSDGYVRFKPSSTGAEYTYAAIQVADPS